MKMLLAFFALGVVLPFSTHAAPPLPDELKLSIPAAPGPPLSSSHLGSSVAVDGPLTVLGAPFDGVSNAGMAKVFDSNTGQLLFILRDPDLRASHFGASVAISGTRVVVGAPEEDVGFSNVGKVYIYDLAGPKPGTPVAILSNPTPANGDSFGNAVAISGTRVVVGAWKDDAGAKDTGCAYVYDLGNATPTTPIVTLNHPIPSIDAWFGISVGIDGSLVAVGSQKGSVNGARVFIYDLGGATPAAPVLSLDDPEPSDNFGTTVAISGSRLVVGAPFGHSAAGFVTGKAYIYDLSAATPSLPVLTLARPDSSGLGRFGGQVAISGQRVVVSERVLSSTSFSDEKVHVYDLSSAAPEIPVVDLLNPGKINGGFGVVAISGAHLVIGTPYSNSSAPGSGIAYGYNLASAAPDVPAVTFSSPALVVDNRFGSAMAVSGTLMVVGTHVNSTSAPSGYVPTVYVYDLAGATPGQPLWTLRDPDESRFSDFGLSVAISGKRVAVGAPGASKAYAYDLAGPSPANPVATLSDPTDLFGVTLGISGTHVVVGAPNAGVAHVYDLASAMPEIPIVTLSSPTPEATGFFGLFVAISGSRVVASDTRYTTGPVLYVFDLAAPTTPVARLGGFIGNLKSIAIDGTRIVAGDVGYASVLDLTSTLPLQRVAIYISPKSDPLFAFGDSVAISGNHVAIGAPGSRNSKVYKGIVFLYELGSELRPEPAAILGKPNADFGDQFGSAVALSGGILAVGAEGDDTVDRNKGAVYAFGAAAPDFQQLAIKGDTVPGAGEDPRIPADATWNTFGVPAIDDSGAVAFFAKWKSQAGGAGSGIFGGSPSALLVAAGDTAVDEAGNALPGVAFKAFQDPVAAGGGVAFLATLSGAGVDATNNIALYHVRDGALRMVAREAQEMPGLPGSALHAIKSAAVDGSTVLFTGTLRIGAGGVTSQGDGGAWRWQGIGTLAAVVREGQVLAGVSASPVKSFRLLKTASGSPGTGRGLWHGDIATFQAAFADGSSAVVDADPLGATTLYASGAATVPGAPGALWKTFGPPATPGATDGVAFLATLKTGVGGVTGASAKRLFFQGASLASVALGAPAPGLPGGAIFSAFKDPVISPGSAAFAFAGIGKLGGTGTPGVWWLRDGESLRDAIALAGEAPPESASGVAWSAFTSLAATDRGPLFTARLSGATTTSDNGLWAADSFAELRQILREGDQLHGQTIKNLTVLTAPSTSQGVRRSYTSDGQVVARVTFTDGSSELLRITLP